MDKAGKVVIIDPKNWLDSEALRTAIASGSVTVVNNTVPLKPIANVYPDKIFKPGTKGTNKPYVKTKPDIKRNQPCPCGSGKKYKKCCL